MLGRSLFLMMTLSAAPAERHHAECVVSALDGFMTCGAHSGAISFNLQSYGPVTERTDNLVLCSDRKVMLQSLEFSWVEAEDETKHFPMRGLRYRQVSENCAMLGGLNFTPPADFAHAEQNAWKLEIYVEGVTIPSTIYVEAINVE